MVLIKLAILALVIVVGLTVFSGDYLEPFAPFGIAGIGAAAGSFFFQADDGIRDGHVTGVQTCALPISPLGRKGRTQLRSRPARSGGVRSRRRWREPGECPFEQQRGGSPGHSPGSLRASPADPRPRAGSGRSCWLRRLGQDREDVRGG